MNKNKRGFTLVEVLVVVLIIGILAAIAVPSYNYAVEKSRASYAITSLRQIAKAQTAYNARVGSYSTEARDLTLDMKDVDGTNANGNEFTDKFFNYKLYGDTKKASTAERNNGEYELSIDYVTGKLYCRPIEHKICRDLNLDEGRSYEPVWSACSGQIDSLWQSNFGVTDNKEQLASSCQVRVDEDNNKIDFEFCFSQRTKINIYTIGKFNNGMSAYPENTHCYTGSFLDEHTLTFNDGSGTRRFYQKDDNGLILSSCEQYDKENKSCTDASMEYRDNAYGSQRAVANCTEFDSEGNCTNLTCLTGDCSVFNVPMFFQE